MSAFVRWRSTDAAPKCGRQLFKNCIRIARREELLESDKYWKLFALICGGLLIAVAVGWLKSDDEDGSGISIRLS